jgi:microcystin-dependent protein
MSDPYIGQIQVFGFNFPPRGWAFCEGQLLSIPSYSALFSLLGTTYGGDGRTTFGLPDMRGRTCVSPGNGPGLTQIRWGEKAGTNTNTLNTNQLPTHNHGIQASSSGGDASSPINNYMGTAEDSNRNAINIYQTAQDGNSRPTQNAGGGNPVNNMQPFLGMYWCIALQGIYPSRN